MEDPQAPTETAQEQPLTKPKRTRTVTEEQRKALADNMRKVNQARIDKAKLANEKILAEKEAKLNSRLESIQTKKQAIRKLKDEAAAVPQPTTPAQVATPPPEKAARRRVKKIIIQEDYNSGNSDDDDEETYMETRSKAKAAKLLKDKEAPKAPMNVAKKDLPPYCFKFV